MGPSSLLPIYRELESSRFGNIVSLRRLADLACELEAQSDERRRRVTRSVRDIDPFRRRDQQDVAMNADRWPVSPVGAAAYLFPVLSLILGFLAVLTSIMKSFAVERMELAKIPPIESRVSSVV